MRNAHQLQFNKHYNKLSIQHDLTKKQSNKFTWMKEESRRAEEQDTSHRFKYRVRGPPGKWEIVKLPKN